MVPARLGIAQRVRVRKWCRGRQRQRHDRVIQRQTVATNDRAHVISSAQPADLAKSARSPEEGRGRYRRPGRRNRPGGSRLAPHRSLVPRPRRLPLGTQCAERKEVARSSAVSSAIRCWTLDVERWPFASPVIPSHVHLSSVTYHSSLRLCDPFFSSLPAPARHRRILGCSAGRNTSKRLAMSRRSIIPICAKTGNVPILCHNWSPHIDKRWPKLWQKPVRLHLSF